MLRGLCTQFVGMQCRRQVGTAVRKLEPIPKAPLLQKCTEIWQERHRYKIQKIVKEQGVSEAVTYFYREVKTPDQRIISVLLTAIGKTGHTALAFKLFKEMRARNIRPTKANLTCLFNACAMNRENSEYALLKAHNLYEQIKIQGYPCSQITYHSMIKAFAMHGDTETCFKLLDEMAASEQAITADTYNHLLMACVGDKKLGLVLSIRVMRLMLWQRIKPSIKTYQLLLRSAADCGCGESVDVLNKLLNDARASQLKDRRVLRIDSGQNLLDVKLSDSLLSVAEVPKSLKGKMALIGGIDGLFNQLEYFKLQPDSTLCSMFLKCIDEEYQLIQLVDRLSKTKLDIGFWNQLLKKCIVEKYECTEDMYKKLVASRLPYDIVTFGVLAMRCQTPEQVHDYLSFLERRNTVPNEVIMSTLINNTSRNYRFEMLEHLLKICTENEIGLNQKAIHSVHVCLDSNKKRFINRRIETLLKRVRVQPPPKSRLLQFEPKLFKRIKSRWDDDADDEDIREEEEKVSQNAQARLKLHYS